MHYLLVLQYFHLEDLSLLMRIFLQLYVPVKLFESCKIGPAPFRKSMLNWLPKNQYNNEVISYLMSFFNEAAKVTIACDFHSLSLEPVCKQFLLISTNQIHHKSHDLVKQPFYYHENLMNPIIWEMLLRCLLRQLSNEGDKIIHKRLVGFFVYLMQEVLNWISFSVEFCTCIWWRVYSIWGGGGGGIATGYAFDQWTTFVINIFFVEKRNVTYNFIHY